MTDNNPLPSNAAVTSTGASVAATANLQRHNCIAVACTECGEHYNDDHTCHFATLTDALRAIAADQWTLTHEALLCFDCRERASTHACDTAQIVVLTCEYCAPPLFSETPAPDRCRCHDPTARHIWVPFIARHHRGFEPLSCVTLRCGGCGDGLDDDEHEPHFSTPGKALAAAKADGWVVTDPLICCGRCGSQQLAHRRFVEPAAAQTSSPTA